MTELCDLAIKNGTDKGPNGWGYTKEYFRVLGEHRAEVATILEAGVYCGDSLRTWRDFFPNAMIFGVEIDMRFLRDVDDPHIKIFNCDVYDSAIMSNVLREIGEIDFFIDDCLHKLPEQTKLLEMIWPHIRMGGLYAIEESYGNNIAALQTVIAGLPGVVRDEVIYAGSDYSLTLLTKGPK